MSCTAFASRTLYFTIEGSYISSTCDLAVSNLKKDTAKGKNYLHVHHSSNLHPSTYLPVSILHTLRVTIPTLIWNVAPEGIFNLCRTVIPTKMLVAFWVFFPRGGLPYETDGDARRIA